jgi:hypothetical protein
MKKAEKEMILFIIDEMMALVQSGISEPDDEGFDVLNGMKAVYKLIEKWPEEGGLL